MNIFKNIPRKPDYMSFGMQGKPLVDVWLCPHCNNTVGEMYTSLDYKWLCEDNGKTAIKPQTICNECGQKIKW